jgi:hypothetical protein
MTCSKWSPNINRWVILLYVCYLSQNMYEERKAQYGDLLHETSYEYTTEEQDEDEETVDDEYKLSVYEYEDSSNYFQAITKAIFCLFN